MKRALPFLASVLTAVAAAEEFEVNIRVDAGGSMGPLEPIWRFFGADEPNYATMKNGRELLGDLGEMKPGEVFFRTHNLMTSGDGTPALKWGSTGMYGEDGRGRPIYDWEIVDGIFDAYLENGVRPYVQIGFMPEALSVKPQPYRHHWTPRAKYDEIYTGWAYPPKDYAKWEELVFQWAKHCVEKYGEEEVLRWYWQTWNEPNIGYWRGSREEFFKLHDHAIHAVRRALPGAKVGGPDVAGGPGGDFLEAFIKHCMEGKNAATGETGTPMDFISFHAKGWPKTVDGRVQMGIANQLRDIDRAFEVIARYPQLRKTPIVIGESDPEGCAACQGDQLAYRNGTMYSSYTAASFPRKLDLARKRGVNLEGALTWAFEFEDQPYFAGFRSLATNGINKPVLNVFRMFSMMSGERLPVASDGALPLDEIVEKGVRERPDVGALAARDGKRITILTWHYHDDDLPGAEAAVSITLVGAPEGKPVSVAHYRVDQEHSNSFTMWQAMGSPQKPTEAQVTELKAASELVKLDDGIDLVAEGGATAFKLDLPRQGVSLHVLEWD
ncbi:xylan1,4-beta-xylosidase [Haloferula helveola]|uniref:Xylan1,4-beta-xylosidase n=1 Tax=Haloferula helveola TaxID=490095 RepID=A0ABN6H2F8_9BACT|nr:xylan1,4-beta-xylosidase [Haloferula helveola]